MPDDEVDTILDRSKRDFDEAIVEFGVGRYHCFIRSNSFVEILLSFAVLLKNLRPGRGDEDGRVIAKSLCGFPDVAGHRNADETKIAEDIRDAAVEEDGACGFLSDVIGAHLPGQHQFRKENPVGPW